MAAYAQDGAAAPALSAEELERLTASGFSFAPSSADAPFTPQAAALVDRIDAYLNEVDTVRARFVQEVVDTGERRTVLSAEGMMYLDRPGRFRFDYDPPHVDPAAVVSDGSIVELSYPELGQSDEVALRATPLHLFVKNDVDLRRDALVTYVSAGNGEVAINLRDPKGEVDGLLTLLFDETAGSLDLKAWEVLDAAGLLTRTTLLNPERDMRLNRRLFRVTRSERPQGLR